MSELLPPVVAVLIAQTGSFVSGMHGAVGEMGKVEAATTKLAAVGKAAFLGLGAAAVAIGAESVKLASSFDQQMELVHTQAGASQAEVDQLKNSVLALAPAVGIGPEKLAEGLYHVESAGFRGKEALDITAAAARDAAIGLADMDTVSQALIGTMASGIGGVKDAADAAAYLNQIVGIGDMRMDKLSAAISTGILPSFRSAGLQMNDFGAALATITDNATPADEAATRLRMTVSLMSAPSGPAIKALKSIGISSTQLADDMRKPDGLLNAVMDLKTHLEKAGLSASQQNQVIQKAFGGGKTSGAILTLLEESDRLKDKYNELGTSASRGAKYQDAWAAQQKQFSQQMKQLGAEAQTLGIKLGNQLIPKIQALVGWLAQHTGAVKIAAAAIGGVLVAAIGVWTAAVIENTIAMLADPATWIFLGIVAAAALVGVAIYELVKHWDTVWSWIKRISLDVWHALQTAWNATWNALKASVNWINNEIIKPIARFFGAVVDAWNATGNALKAAANWINNDVIKPIGRFFAEIPKAWQATWNGIKAGVSWIANNVLKPVAEFYNTVLVKPIKEYLKILTAAYEFAWGFMSVIIGDFVKIWKNDWRAIENGASWAWNNVLKPTFAFIDQYGIQPVEAGFRMFVNIWKNDWRAIENGASWAWNNVLKPTFAFIDQYGIQPLETAFREWVNTWKTLWHDVENAANWAWSNVLKPTFGFIENTGIQGLKATINALKTAWDTAWGGIKSAVSSAWNDGLKPAFGFIDKNGIAVLKSVINGFKTAWNTVWNGIKSTVDGVWNHLKPIFDAIGRAISSVVGGIHNILNAPGAAGQALAHMLGFAEGGPVPGAPGEPMLAVVHGGEFVLSRDMIASLRNGPSVSGTYPLPAMAAGLGAQTIIVENHNHLYLDGKELVAGMTPEVQRYKRRNGFSPFG